MAIRDAIRRVASLRRSRTTVRRRLTLLYGGLFLASGAILLAITYGGTSARSVTAMTIHASRHSGAGPPVLGGGTISAVPQPIGPLPAALVSSQRGADLHQLLLVSAIALGVMGLISIVLGSLVAGRVLRPLRAMTATTRQISADNLHERLAVAGPRDELKQLGDTIDDLLGRLESAFDAQRRFVANASHELRTPLTLSRALLEMTLDDPDATVDSFRTACRQALEAGAEQEALIDALLMLARSQRGLGHREPLDLALIVGDVVEAHRADLDARGLRLEVRLSPARLHGDPRLLERLASNLLDNAARYNLPDGRVEVSVETRDGRPTLSVQNTGPLVPAGEIQRLLQPFQRAAAERVGEHDGHGLGLSIVAAIAAAHDAELDVKPAEGGGLEVEVRFQGAAPRAA